MLRARLLNSDASLNNFIEIQTINYVPGEDFDVVFRLFLDQLDIRWVPPATATVTVDILLNDGTTLTKTASLVDADDRSMWTFSVDSTESVDLAGFNMGINVDILDDGTEIKKAVIQNSLSKILLSGDC